MHDAVLVGVGEPFRHLGRDLDRARGRERLAGRHQRAQLAALEELHRHVGDVAALADVVDGDDVGMVEAARGLGFLVEARLVLRHLLRVERHVDGLDRDHAGRAGGRSRGRRPPSRPCRARRGSRSVRACGFPQRVISVGSAVLLLGPSRCGTPGPKSGGRPRLPRARRRDRS